MYELSGNTGALEGNCPLRVFIAHADFPARSKALRVLSRLAGVFGSGMELQPLPWPFSVLAQPDAHGEIAEDLHTADVLVVSADDPHALPTAVERWMENAIHQKRGSATAIVTLFGPEGRWDNPTSPRLLRMQLAARRAELDFFAPTCPTTTTATATAAASTQIHPRAETVAAASPAAAAPTAVSVPPLTLSQRGARILIVDDDACIRLRNSLVLTAAGYCVAEAADGLEALAVARANRYHYDLIITDNQMPRLSGLDFIRILRTKRVLVPVVLACGSVDSEPVPRRPSLACAAALPKPYASDQLLATVRAVLQSTSDAGFDGGPHARA